MPKRKGLGRDIAKSLEIMDDLLKGLRKLSDAPIKQGLQTNNAYDEKFGKMINESKEQALALANNLEDLRDAVKKIKPNKNSRYGAQRVVANFLGK